MVLTSTVVDSRGRSSIKLPSSSAARSSQSEVFSPLSSGPIRSRRSPTESDFLLKRTGGVLVLGNIRPGRIASGIKTREFRDEQDRVSSSERADRRLSDMVV